MALEDFTVPLQFKQPQVQGFDLGDVAKKYSGITSDLAYAANAQSETKKREFDLATDQMGRAAKDVLMQPEGQDRTDRWNSYIDDFHKKGWMTDKEHDHFKDNPSELALNQMLAHSMNAQTNAAMTGQTAEAEAAGRSKHQFETINPLTHSTGYPALGAGAPPTNVGRIPNGVPGAAAPTVSYGQQRDGGIQQPTPPVEAQAEFAKDPYYQHAPVIPMGSKQPTGPGIVNPGLDPVAGAAKEQGLKQLNEEIGPAVTAAAKTKAELGSLKSEFESGKVATSRLAEIKQTIGGFMYGMFQGTMGNDGAAALAKKLTGLDLPWSEVAAKDTTRMGLTFARQTEGAREAVQAIRIALGANPSLLNTVQGNLKVINIMDKGADYDMERGKGAQSYFLKQQDATGVPHLTGFDNWFAKENPPANFISKAVPYQVPTLQAGGINKGELKDGVTYEWGEGNKRKEAVWDEKNQHFMPVVK